MGDGRPEVVGDEVTERLGVSVSFSHNRLTMSSLGDRCFCCGGKFSEEE